VSGWYNDCVLGFRIVAGLKVRPHRKWAAAASSDMCPQREGIQIVLRKIASSPSNRRQADVADQSRSRWAVDFGVLETDLSGGQYRMAEEFTENLIHKKIFEKAILVQLKFYTDMVIFAQTFPVLIDFVCPPPSPFSFTTQC